MQVLTNSALSLSYLSSMDESTLPDSSNFGTSASASSSRILLFAVFFDTIDMAVAIKCSSVYFPSINFPFLVAVFDSVVIFAAVAAHGLGNCASRTTVIYLLSFTCEQRSDRTANAATASEILGISQITI